MIQSFAAFWYSRWSPEGSAGCHHVSLPVTWPVPLRGRPFCKGLPQDWGRGRLWSLTAMVRMLEDGTKCRPRRDACLVAEAEIAPRAGRTVCADKRPGNNRQYLRLGRSVQWVTPREIGDLPQVLRRMEAGGVLERRPAGGRRRYDRDDRSEGRTAAARRVNKGRRRGGAVDTASGGFLRFLREVIRAGEPGGTDQGPERCHPTATAAEDSIHPPTMTTRSTALSKSSRVPGA